MAWMAHLFAGDLCIYVMVTEKWSYHLPDGMEQRFGFFSCNGIGAAAWMVHAYEDNCCFHDVLNEYLSLSQFYGFGGQFSHIEFKGRRVPILVQEQGIGRGDQPIILAANLIHNFGEPFFLVIHDGETLAEINFAFRRNCRFVKGILKGAGEMFCLISGYRKNFLRRILRFRTSPIIIRSSIIKIEGLIQSHCLNLIHYFILFF
ncbi:uncharacterized protein LOC110033582 isoform X2 [Phalaenopsis equestris]|nr:uncharacterized protein LOC110033582 isoform X2 [Phalaenopsis equestris]